MMWLWVAAWSLVGIARGTAVGSTLYLGLPGGTSMAYVGDGTGWTAVPTADLPDIGYNAFPAFADLDGDGDRDALVGDSSGHVVAFANTGSNAVPVWTRQPAWDVAGAFGTYSAPALGDLDGDGDADLVVGNRAGEVHGLENTGGRGAPVWTERDEWLLTAASADARPAIGDVNGDGHVDLLVAHASGAVQAYAGTGDATVPLIRQVDWDPTGAGERVTIALGDLDGDGRLELMMADAYAHVRAFDHAGAAWTPRVGWVAPPDPGSGPIGLALVVGTAGAEPPVGNRSPTARLGASPVSGAPPLEVQFDATGSTDPDGNGLTYAWDFGDDNPAHGRGTGPVSDPAAEIRGAAADYATSRAARDAGRYDEEVTGYLAAAARFMSLTSFAIPGPVKVKNVNRIDRVARWYLSKIGHDLGGTYMYHSFGLSICDRYSMSLQYSREAAAQAAAGGFPSISAINGTNANIATAIAHLKQANCPVPPGAPMFGAEVEPAGGTAGHTYANAGIYTATVTVSDGTTSASASVTITVGDDVPPPAPPPPDAGQDEPFEGFGATTPGGAGGTEIHVTEATEGAVANAFHAARGGHAIIVFDVRGPIVVHNPLPLLDGAFITVEGNGAMIVGSGFSRTAAMIDVRGHDVVVRRLRLRNGGDNIRAQGPGAYNIVFSHLSSTGSGDDGISIGYGARDVTVQYCFLAGNTRSIFLKYGTTTNVSVHHSWLMKQWIRGPLVSTNVRADLRNNIVEDWDGWATRFEADSSGNVVNSLFVLGPYAKKSGGSIDALRLIQSGPVFTAGNVYQGLAKGGPEGNASAPIDAPPVTTLPVAEMQAVVNARAGCLPRDVVDQAYIDLRDGWHTGKFEPLRLAP